eukprot:10335047-Alexandrium_andersonii.AAC.1
MVLVHGPNHQAGSLQGEAEPRTGTLKHLRVPALGPGGVMGGVSSLRSHVCSALAKQMMNVPCLR